MVFVCGAIRLPHVLLNLHLLIINISNITTYNIIYNEEIAGDSYEQFYFFVYCDYIYISMINVYTIYVYVFAVNSLNYYFYSIFCFFFYTQRVSIIVIIISYLVAESGALRSHTSIASELRGVRSQIALSICRDARLVRIKLRVRFTIVLLRS